MYFLEIGGPEELPSVAEAVIRCLRERGDGGESCVVAFFGAMGAGKTTLIREIARQLGVTDNVTSPTFAIVNRYRAADGSYINHFDFYRIGRVEEAFDLGYEEYFYGGELCLVEWPEKVEALLPDGTMAVRIEVTGDQSRRVTIVNYPYALQLMESI